MTTEHEIMVELASIFDQMDEAYDQVAAAAGFQCNGCEDNCCRSRFFHHTLTEYRYLRAGLRLLPPGDRKKIRQRAEKAIRLMDRTDDGDQPLKTMCPLNEKGRCILYHHRPMICRLHGIAHQMQRPDGRRIQGPGCDDFYRQCGPSVVAALDRTPHYVAMARLEQQLRQASRYTGKIRMTIAQIIVTDL